MVRLRLFVIKLKLALKSIGHVLQNWRYALLATVVSLAFLILLYWLLNLSLLWYLMSSGQLGLFDKLSLIIKSTFAYLTGASFMQATATVLLVVGQGIVIAMLVYIVRSQNRLDTKAFGGSTIASIIAVFSVGCVSCGTSIIAPILSLFVSGATASLSERINSIAVYISLALVLYAIYSVGITTANYIARQNARITN